MASTEALRLADDLAKYLGGNTATKAAAELRRLSEIETLYLAAMRGRHAMSEELLALTAQRDALLAIVRRIADQGCVTDDGCGYCLPCEAEAAIKAVEGK